MSQPPLSPPSSLAKITEISLLGERSGVPWTFCGRRKGERRGEGPPSCFWEDKRHGIKHRRINLQDFFRVSFSRMLPWPVGSLVGAHLPHHPPSFPTHIPPTSPPPPPPFFHLPFPL
ncbi:hypothetical protein IE53DRAFT_22450 [Violaceomyces palustris]|uniref:Uncharacterized protein n=1 Tax=Violaceomyces palustris TaxID=1673888 RepID=A0ACD0P1R4_9BASI|nr:hypothetical protein IE53DRAFT_22450 [Violaceomyces palustris]